MKHIFAAIMIVYGIEVKYYLHSVCDNSEVCAKLLKRFRAKQDMTDLLHQYDADIVKKIYNKQTELMQVYTDFVQTSAGGAAKNKQKKIELSEQLKHTS